MKTYLFQSCGHCWVFQICWHVECSTFKALSFRIWNSSTGIPSPPLALFVVMLYKALKWKWSRSVVSDSLQPVDCSPPSSSIHGILQARILEWVAISFFSNVQKYHYTVIQFLAAYEWLIGSTQLRYFENIYWQVAQWTISALSTIGNRVINVYKFNHITSQFQKPEN